MAGLIRKKEPGQAWETEEDTGGGSQTVLSAEVAVTSAQIKALFTTPITLVAAQGAGTLIIPVQLAVAYIAGATPYTDNGGALVIAPNSDQNFIYFVLANAGFIDQAASMVQATVGGTSAVATSEVANQPLTICESQANPTDGNGTLKVTVAYIVTNVT